MKKSEIQFNEERHEYIVDGVVASTSVTKILGDMGISSDYSFVNKEKLAFHAEVGNIIHEDLEKVLIDKEYEPNTRQGKVFKTWADDTIEWALPEERIALVYKGLVIGGTADIIGQLKTGELFVDDHKTTSSLNRDAVAWQTSILDYMFRKSGGVYINGKLVKWEGAPKRRVWWWCKNTGVLNNGLPIELKIIPDEEIEELLDCLIENKEYKPKELAVPEKLELEIERAEHIFMQKKEEADLAKKEVDNLRASLIKIFEEQGIKRWETPSFNITYIEPSESLRFDTRTFQKENPEIASQYQVKSKRKGHVRVTIKKNKIREEEE